MSPKTATIEPRCETDRKMVGRLHTRLFELTLQSMERLERILTDPETPRREFLMALKLCAERTVPVLHRITADAARAQLPTASDEKVPAEVVVSPEVQDLAADEFLRRIGAAPVTNGTAH